MNPGPFSPLTIPDPPPRRWWLWLALGVAAVRVGIRLARRALVASPADGHPNPGAVGRHAEAQTERRRQRGPRDRRALFGCSLFGVAGAGVGENMMSGEIRVKGDASQAAGATGRGGLLVIDGNASSRCGISMKGIDIVVKGSIHVTYTDGTEETVNAGEVYYWPPGHTVRVDEDYEAIEFSPSGEMGELIEHLAEKLKG